MPEGDTVWRTAQRLHAALSGDVLVQADLRWPSLATIDLRGRTVLEVVSAGKNLLTRIAAGPTTPPTTVHSHLRMEGSWRVHRTGEAVGPSRSADVRAVLGNDRWTALGLRLGMLDVVPTAEEGTLVGHLGPDLLGPDWDLDRAVAAIASAPERTIGEALLDQRNLAGVGTMYMAEALFLRGVTPWTPVRSLVGAPLRTLVELCRRLLLTNSTRAVQATTGDLRKGHERFVHARSGRPCRRCGTPVRVAGLGQAPQDRVAFWCPRCQQGPTPTDDGRPQRPLGASGRRTPRGYRP